MAISLQNETYIFDKRFVHNHYRWRKIRDKHLLSTDHGSWVALDKPEFDMFQRHELTPELFKLLEEKGVILTNNNLHKVVYDYRRRYSFLNHGTSLHIILPTLRCNHGCVYCHSSVKKPHEVEYDMDESTMIKTVDFIFQSPSPSIVIEFQGGETMLRSDLMKKAVLYAEEKNKIAKKDLGFVVVTNLTILTEEVIQFLIAHNIRITTSLDGPEKLHNFNRFYVGGQGSYKDVAEKIIKLQLRGIHVGMLMVTTKESLKYGKEIIDEYVKFGAQEIQLKYLNKLGFATYSMDKIGYDVHEFMDFWRTSVDYIIELNKKGIRIRERFVWLVLQKILTLQDPGFLDFRSPCGIVIGQMAYNYDGSIYSCDEGRNHDLFRLGNVKTHTYQDIVSSKQSQALIALSMNDNLMCDKCAYKPWCGTCIVMNYSESGQMIPRLPENSHHIMFEGMFDYVFEKLLYDEEARDVFLKWLTGESESFDAEQRTNLNIAEHLKNNYPFEKLEKMKKGRFTFLPNRILVADGKKYFLKIYPTERKEHLLHELSIYSFLQNKKYICPLTTLKGEDHFRTMENVYALFPFIEEEGYDHSAIQIRAAAQLLKQFYKDIEGRKLAKKLPIGISSLSNIYKGFMAAIEKISFNDFELNYLGIEKKEFLAQWATSVKMEIDNWLPKLSNLPKQIIHGDFRQENILFNKQQSYLIDFSEVREDFRLHDIASAYLSFRSNQNSDTIMPIDFNIFLNEMQLTDEEKKYLPLFIKFNLMKKLALTLILIRETEEKGRDRHNENRSINIAKLKDPISHEFFRISIPHI